MVVASADTITMPSVGSVSPAILVNRTVPPVNPPPATFALATEPSTAELIRARVFHEPLVPVGGSPDATENRALGQALLGHAQRLQSDDSSHLETFLSAHPRGKWTVSVLTSLGEELLNDGYYSRAIECWRTAWSLAKSTTDPKARAVADRAGTELAAMYARMGQIDALTSLLQEFEGRTLVGSPAERLAGAREGLWLMLNRPELSFRCGPVALDRIRAAQNPDFVAHHYIRDSHATTNGYSMTQELQLARDLGMFWQVAFRDRGAALITPAVVHWKLGHYAALLRPEEGRYLVQDAAFRYNQWFCARAIEEEASGYFLVPPGALPAGWRAVADNEAGRVWGKGPTTDNDPDADTDEDKMKDEDLSCHGMATHNIHLMLVNLRITDTPVGYRPPVGPAVGFRVSYNHREAGQPAVFGFANLGTRWTFDWSDYIKEIYHSQMNFLEAFYRGPGGGTLPFGTFGSTTATVGPQLKSQATLRLIAVGHYEMLFPNGSKRVFGPVRAGSAAGNVFLSQVVDPAGNAVTLTYDDTMRVRALTDAIGQVTTIAYTQPDDPYKITRVTDPFGRAASFAYDAYGRLTNITDVIGLQSQFSYEGSSDFIQALTTPYGTTRFARGESGRTRWLETTLPNGEKERVEYTESQDPGIPFREPASLVPKGMLTANQWLGWRDTFYWDRRAYPSRSSPTPYASARLYHWLHSPDYQMAIGILESEKMPLENRVWYNYPGQAQLYGGSNLQGTSDKPSVIGRVLDDGTTQLRQFTYNPAGNVTRSVDPLGRAKTYVYSTNNVDLLEIRQTTGANNELLLKFLYDSAHHPVAIWDASGQMTTNTYNARGQLLTTTNPKGETQAFSYDTTNGYLLAIDGPLPGTNDLTRFTYDAVGRARTVTDVDGYTLAFAYDNLDRLTNITYPDGTFEAFTFDRLDFAKRRDRLGRESTYTYDALRQLVADRDPLNRITRFEYCGCGSMSGLIDAMGRKTAWDHDVQGRLTSKQYADGSRIGYNYEAATSRLKTVVDEKGQIKIHEYNLDDTLRRVSYSNAQIPTPAVTFGYDPNYNRMVSMQDGIGTTIWNYRPAGALGALKLASVSGPFTNDTITYTYDEVGRPVQRAVNGVAQQFSFDPLGRVTNATNVLGAFTYTYDGATARPLSLSRPNGVQSLFSYLGDAGDRRLQQIQHMGPASNIISAFAYSYDIAGRILTWSQQADAGPAQLWTIGYDNADQLTSVNITQNGLQTKAYAYTYDLAGNRLAHGVDGQTTDYEYNALNEQNHSSSTLPDTTYQWNGAMRLVAIVRHTNQTAFTYDGLGRCRRIVDVENGTEVANRTFTWDALTLVEERNASGAYTEKRFLANGLQVESGPRAGSYFYTLDHLGSVREVMNRSATVEQRAWFDPYGETTFSTSMFANDFGFTRHFYHTRSQLYLAPYRAYSTELGRWISRDFLEESADRNLYTYARNDPINRIDPLGLWYVDVGLGDFFNFGSATGFIGVAVGFRIDRDLNVYPYVAPGFGVGRTHSFRVQLLGEPSVGANVKITLTGKIPTVPVFVNCSARTPWHINNQAPFSLPFGLPFPGWFNSNPLDLRSWSPNLGVGPGLGNPFSFSAVLDLSAPLFDLPYWFF
jgi:RHS repeat-associated protein